MPEIFAFAQSLPWAGKLLAIVVVTTIWLFVCYAILQRPKPASHIETPAQASSASRLNTQVASEVPDLAAGPKRQRAKRAREPRQDRSATVSIGDVSSQNQTGGVTAGYIDKVDQHQ